MLTPNFTNVRHFQIVEPIKGIRNKIILQQCGQNPALTITDQATSQREQNYQKPNITLTKNHTLEQSLKTSMREKRDDSNLKEFVKMAYVPGTTASIHSSLLEEGKCDVVSSCPLNWTSEARAAIHPLFKMISCIFAPPRNTFPHAGYLAALT